MRTTRTTCTPNPPATLRFLKVLAAAILLALGASACTVAESGVSIGAADEQVAADSSSNDRATSNDVEPAATQREAEPDDGYFGDEPLLQTFRLSADGIRWNGNPYGLDHTFTEIDDDDNDLRYMAVGGDAGLRASYLRVADRLEICVETSDGCGGGDPSALSFFFGTFPALSFSAYGPYTLDEGLRIAGGILLGESVGWEITDPNYSFDGRPGQCYTSQGFYQWTGDPEPTEIAFPAGDVACVIFYEYGGEMLISYDFGGDGSLEVETLRVADSYTEADLAHPAYAPAELGQAGLDGILMNIEAAVNSGDDFQILAG